LLSIKVIKRLHNADFLLMNLDLGVPVLGACAVAAARLIGRLTRVVRFLLGFHKHLGQG
jgi:hypothetical protein